MSEEPLYLLVEVPQDGPAATAHKSTTLRVVVLKIPIELEMRWSEVTVSHPPSASALRTFLKVCCDLHSSEAAETYLS